MGEKLSYNDSNGLIDSDQTGRGVSKYNLFHSPTSGPNDPFRNMFTESFRHMVIFDNSRIPILPFIDDPITSAFIPMQ